MRRQPGNCRHSALRRATICLLLTISLNHPARAATPPNLHLNDPGTDGLGSTQCVPVVRSLGDKLIAVWTDIGTGASSEQRIQYAVSTDSGATFLDMGILPTPVNGGGVFYRWRGDPQLAIDAGSGAFFAAGQISSLSGPNHAGIAVVKGTFSGSVFTWGTPVLVRDVSGSITRFGVLGFDAGAAGGSLHLLFANYLGGGGVIDYWRSTDANGAVWSAPVTLSSAPDQGSVMFPHLVAGPGGNLHAAWAGPVSECNEPIRYRSSSDLGVTWGAEQTPVGMRMNPVLPGSILITLDGIHRTAFSMAVNRSASSATVGRVAFAWAESWDFSDEAFPALTATPLQNEIEPNNVAGQAQAFSRGDALQGTMSSTNDLDFWQVTLAAGDPLLLWADSTAGVTVGITIFDTDGTSAIANGYSGPARAAFAFRAPRAGTYFLQVSPAVGVFNFNYYRVRTRAGLPGPGEARDLRDIAVAYSTPTGWSSVVHPAFGPVGFDDYLPTIGFASDGLDYVTWYDLNRNSVLGASSNLVVARNLAGADPVPSPPVTVTDAEFDWNTAFYFAPPSWGSSNDVASDSRRLHMAWTDGRLGTPDTYAASLSTGAAMGPCPNDTTVVPGSTVVLRIGLLNRNLLFEEKAFVQVAGARSWPGALVARDSVGPGSWGTLRVPVVIPDTAAAGHYSLALTVTRQSGVPLGTCNVGLDIRGAVGVGSGHAPAFALDPITPNPTHGAASVGFALPGAGRVRVTVYGVSGNLVRTLVSGDRPAGPQVVQWDGMGRAARRVPAGLYLVQVEAAGRKLTRPVMVLR